MRRAVNQITKARAALGCKDRERCANGRLRGLLLVVASFVAGKTSRFAIEPYALGTVVALAQTAFFKQFTERNMQTIVDRVTHSGFYKAVMKGKGFVVLAVIMFAPGISARAAAQTISLESDIGFCLDIRDWSTEPGGDAIVWDCHGGANQLFEKLPTPTGAFSLRNLHSGLCLDVQGGSDDDGANVFQWTCNGRSNQLWEQWDDHTVRSVDSKKCLDVRGGGGWGPGTDVIQWSCNARSNQIWWFRAP